MQEYLYEDLYNLEKIHWWHRAKRDLVTYFLEKNLHGKKNKILDVGCGTGQNIKSFSKYGDTWGIDLSSKAVKFCQKRGIRNVLIGSIERIPFKKNTFDAVTALDVLEHVDDSESLKEVRRILKNRGKLIITVPAFPMLWSKWDEVLHHKRRYNKKTLIKLLNKNRFKIIKISYIYSFLFFPALIIRSIKMIFYKNYYPSDFKLSNKLINSLLKNVSHLESFFITNAQIPFGTSLIVVAQKY